MAIKRVDEFDGITEAEIVDFSIEGVAYEIDLSAESKKQLYADLKRYIDAGRRLSGQSRKAPKKSSAAHRPAAETTIDNDAIRDWARKEGRFGEVSDRGRVPRAIVEAFHEAHSPESAKLFSSATA